MMPRFKLFKYRYNSLGIHSAQTIDRLNLGTFLLLLTLLLTFQRKAVLLGLPDIIYV